MIEAKDMNGAEVKVGSRVVYQFGEPPYARGEVKMINRTEGWAQIEITAVRSVGQVLEATFDTLKVI